MKFYEDIKIENSIYWTTGDITCEYLLYKIYNNWISAEITTSEAIEFFENLVKQIGIPETLLEYTLKNLWLIFTNQNLTKDKLIKEIEKIIDLLEEQKKYGRV